ncbi:MAG: DUF4190 domain-containing protein [Fimbriimonadaceae bacterium]
MARPTESFAPPAHGAGPIYPPGFAPQGAAPPTLADRVIPVKNPKALIAYYSGCFSFVLCAAPLLGPVGIILGILGLQECKRNPALPGRGHAIAGIVLGGITTLIVIVVAIIAVLAALNQPRSG